MNHMKKKLLIIGITLILTATVLAGCNETPKTLTDVDKIVGTWKGIQYYNQSAILYTYSLFDDKTYDSSATYAGETSNLSGTWDIINNKFVITTGNQTSTMDYMFSGNNDTLILVENGVPMTLVRQ